ncbi:MAG: hypothetical protein A2096_03100 [Spirochaetes bacterium GWF1_41_5]|nr:MAG: hypothetical protein A2096_03100 [Spirochaetes bacterium GWF1_41_5]
MNTPGRPVFIHSVPAEESGHYPFRLLSAASIKTRGDERFERTDFKYYVFEYILSGRGRLLINSEDFSPAAGDVYILHRNSTHIFYPDPSDPWAKVWFSADGLLVDALIGSLRLNSTYFIRKFSKPELFQKMLAVSKESDAHTRASIIFFEILSAIYRQIYSSQIPVYSQAVLRVKNFIDNHPENNFSMEYLSELARKSSSQLTRLFRRELELSPYEYLLKRKLELARVFLINTSVSIKELAGRLGFNDPYYFSNLFKQKNGISPLLFRKKHWEKTNKAVRQDKS